MGPAHAHVCAGRFNGPAFLWIKPAKRFPKAGAHLARFTGARQVSGAYQRGPLAIPLLEQPVPVRTILYRGGAVPHAHGTAFPVQPEPCDAAPRGDASR